MVPELQLERLNVSILASPDKSDPMNRRAVMPAEADVRGKSCAWIVEGVNGEPSSTGVRLMKALASLIASKPDQKRACAEENILKID